MSRFCLRCLDFINGNSDPGAESMAQWVKRLAVKPDDLSSVLEIHMMEGRRGLFPESCSLTSTCSPSCARACMCKIKCMKNYKI